MEDREINSIERRNDRRFPSNPTMNVRELIAAIRELKQENQNLKREIENIRWLYRQDMNRRDSDGYGCY